MNTRLHCPPLLLLVFLAVLGSYIPRVGVTKLWKRLPLSQASVFVETEPRTARYPTVAERFASAKASASSAKSRASRLALLKDYIVHRRYDVKRNVLGGSLTFRLLTVHCSVKHSLNERLYRAVCPNIRLMPLQEHGRTPLLIERSGDPHMVPPQRPIRSSPEVLLRSPLGFFRRLTAEHPDVNVFIYSTRAYGNSAMHDSLMPGSSYRTGRENVWAQFVSSLPASVSAHQLEYNADSYRQLFYKTDHHWTVNGAWTAYADIIELIRATVPSIGETVNPRNVFSLGFRFRGTYAKAAAFLHQTDELRDMELTLPEYEVYFNGTIKLPRNDRSLLLTGQLAKRESYENYYGIYWGHDYGFLSYQTGEEGRSLLLFADSFSNCMESFLTAHYSDVHVIDLRHYLKDMGQPFVLRRFLQEHPVHDILFMFSFEQILAMADNSLGGMLGAQ